LQHSYARLLLASIGIKLVIPLGSHIGGTGFFFFLITWPGTVLYMLSIMFYHPFSGMILPLVFTAWTSMSFWNALGTVLVVVAGASHALAFIRELQRMTRWNGSRSNMKESSLTNPKIFDLRSFPDFFKFKFWQFVDPGQGFMYLEL
jgi:hypothetical protein